MLKSGSDGVILASTCHSHTIKTLKMTMFGVFHSLQHNRVEGSTWCPHTELDVLGVCGQPLHKRLLDVICASLTHTQSLIILERLKQQHDWLFFLGVFK